MIIFLNHQDCLFCDVFETPNNYNDYFTIITIGPTINRSDASLKSILIILILISTILLDHSDLTQIVGTRLKVKGEHWEGDRRGERRRVNESQISSSYHSCSPFWVSYYSLWVSFFSFSDYFSSYWIKSGVALASR